MRTPIVFLVGAAILVSPLAGQSLSQRIARAPDGIVRMSFAAREGVCGNGRNINSYRSNSRSERNKDGWDWDCEPGPVRVAVDVRGGAVQHVRTYVGGRWRSYDGGGAADLGTVGAREAGEYFLALAGTGTKVNGDPLTPAVLADSIVVWPGLLRIGKNQDVPMSVRRQAIFWLSQEVSEEATRGLAEIAESDTDEQEVRKQAVFALSQLRDGAGVPVMIRVARGDKDPAIRKQAIFWLGQSGDSRAIEFFEEVLTRKP